MGVAGIMLMGGKKREIQINIDKSKLIGYGLSIDMIMNKIRFENINISAGDIKENQFQYNIRSIGEFNNLSEIKI